MNLTDSAPPTPADRISVDIAAIHLESYGEPVEGITTRCFDDSVVCVIDHQLLPHERLIMEGEGGRESVKNNRKVYQEVIGPVFMAAVERATSRRVSGFLSDTHLDPSFSVEFFRLAPTGGA